jgi:uncharacterized protein (TIGR02453 family)
MAKKSVTSKPELFTKKTFVFLRELEKNNTREWFAENKTRYEEEVLFPAIAFVSQMQPGIAKLSSYLLAEPKRMGGSIMRIYRDTRFSKNKTPYKTNVGIHFRHSMGGDVHAPGYYVHVEPDACFVAAGMWMPPSEPLAAIRQAIMDEPKVWRKCKNNSRFTKRFALDGESLKTAPRGIAIDHPEIVDLRRKSFAGVAKIEDVVVMSASLQEEVLTAFSDAKPFMKYLCDALGQPF